MGKVLLIEPHKVLRQAISLSLFPEHDVQAEASMSAAIIGSLNDYDLLIIDGAALRESNQLTAEVTRGIQDCKAAVLWLEDDESSPSPQRDKLVRMQKPIEKKTFESALFELLPADKGSKPGSTAGVHRPQAGKDQGTISKEPTEVSAQSAFQFIDLVDEVEEQPGTKQEKGPGRRSRKSK